MGIINRIVSKHSCQSVSAYRVRWWTMAIVEGQGRVLSGVGRNFPDPPGEVRQCRRRNGMRQSLRHERSFAGGPRWRESKREKTRRAGMLQRGRVKVDRGQSIDPAHDATVAARYEEDALALYAAGPACHWSNESVFWQLVMNAIAECCTGVRPLPHENKFIIPPSTKKKPGNYTTSHQIKLLFSPHDLWQSLRAFYIHFSNNPF